MSPRPGHTYGRRDLSARDVRGFMAQNRDMVLPEVVYGTDLVDLCRPSDRQWLKRAILGGFVPDFNSLMLATRAQGLLVRTRMAASVQAGELTDAEAWQRVGADALRELAATVVAEADALQPGKKPRRDLNGPRSAADL